MTKQNFDKLSQVTALIAMPLSSFCPRNLLQKFLSSKLYQAALKIATTISFRLTKSDMN